MGEIIGVTWLETIQAFDTSHREIGPTRKSLDYTERIFATNAIIASKPTLCDKLLAATKGEYP